jgi:hypothetical protein
MTERRSAPRRDEDGLLEQVREIRQFLLGIDGQNGLNSRVREMKEQLGRVAANVDEMKSKLNDEEVGLFARVAHLEGNRRRVFWALFTMGTTIIAGVLVALIVSGLQP